MLNKHLERDNNLKAFSNETNNLTNDISEGLDNAIDTKSKRAASNVFEESLTVFTDVRLSSVNSQVATNDHINVVRYQHLSMTQR